jgi:hypothetical protein
LVGKAIHRWHRQIRQFLRTDERVNVQLAMLLVPLDRHGLELLFLAALDPKRAGLFDRRRNAARRVNASRHVVAGFDEPGLAGALFGELFCAAGAGAVSIGRKRSKLLVLLGHILGEEWRHQDDHEKTSYEIMRARSLMIELVGGEPAQQLRDQFA